jgi:pimeloyl-ACP methyl ester carboxylesterase
LPDGRRLGYAIIGKGSPVLYFHGTASSRLEIYLLKRLAVKGNLQLIAIDRPGYGLSTYKPRKNIQDINCDLNYVVDQLGIEQFNVLGWSGGGVFALAYMTGFPQRVNHGVIAGTPDLPFDASTAHNNIPFAKYVMKLPFIGTIAIHNMRRQILKANTPDTFLHSSQGKQTLHTCSNHDLTFFSNPTWMRVMHQSMAEAFRQNNSTKSVLEEHKLFLNPWNLPFKNINNKLWIWQGTEDKTCPIKNAYNITHRIKDCTLEIFPQQGHCAMFDNLEKLANILKNS